MKLTRKTFTAADVRTFQQCRLHCTGCEHVGRCELQRKLSLARAVASLHPDRVAA